MSQIDDAVNFIPVRIAILTISDTRSLVEDKSGQVLVNRIEAAGHHVADRLILQDEREEIARQLRSWISLPEIDVIISTGGTGLTPLWSPPGSQTGCLLDFQLMQCCSASLAYAGCCACSG